MPFVTSPARRRVDRIAAAVGALVFLIGIAAVVWGANSQIANPTAVSTSMSSPIPGGSVTQTVQTTEPPVSTRPPRVTTEVTVTEGAGPGEVVVTTSPVGLDPFLGSSVAGISFQVLLVTLTAILIGFATQRMLLGFVGPGVPAMPNFVPPVDEAEAAAVKNDALAAQEAADLSRPLFDRVGVPDPRMRLLQSRVALELDVRQLAQVNDLPSGLTIPYVVKGLVDKKKMTPKLASAVVSLAEMGDRISNGAALSPDAVSLLTDAYAQTLAKVGGKVKRGS